MSNYVIAADIGNTNTHIGLINRGSRSILSLDIFPSKEIDNRLVQSIASLSQSMKHAGPVSVVLSSVIKSVEQRLGQALSLSVKAPVSWVRYSPSLSVTVRYDDASRLGADRLADCLYGADVARGRNLILIDAGTTITVDYLKAGREFTGGAILPGLSTQLKSLSDHTELLPLVDENEIGMELPGLSTKACILGGVRWGIAGALSFLVEKYKSNFGEDSSVLTTGGSWKYVQDLVSFPFEFIPEMTLVGCALFQRDDAS
jgi:type III pantothenate kinase